MLAELVHLLITINLFMRTVMTQYYANPYGNQFYGNIPQQYYQAQPETEYMDYEEPMEHEHNYRRYNRYKKYGSSGGKLATVDYEYDRSDECRCSCNRCRDTYRPPKPCCYDVCNSCSEQPTQQGQQGQQGQGSVVLVPYPYPLMVPSLTTNATTTTTTTTTTTEKPITIQYLDLNKGDEYSKIRRKSSAETINDLILRSQNLRNDKKYMLTTLRKTRPTWEPKYNIVPIPDNLAQKLMSQLRQVRELQARRF